MTGPRASGVTTLGLFTRLGRIFYIMRSANTFLAGGDISAGGLKSIGVVTDNLEAQYQSALQYLMDQVYANRDSVRTALDGWKSYLKGLAENTLIEQVHADNPLNSKTVENALKELLYQLKGSGTIIAADNDVDASTVAVTSSAATGNTGVYGVIVSAKMADGRACELSLGETLDLVFDSDAQNGGTARQETYTVKGEREESDPLSVNWPKGSGAIAAGTVVDCDGDNDLGNLLAGSDFDVFTTTNVPDYWGAPIVGTTTTHVASSTSTYRGTGKSLQLIGDGATLTAIAQAFGATSLATGTSGTTASLKPNTRYHVGFWGLRSTGLAAGTLRFRWLDGSNAAVTDDTGSASGTAFTKAYSVFNDSTWTFAGGVLVTPKKIPASGIKLGIGLSVAMTNGETWNIDDLSLTEVTPLYDGGPCVSVHAGTTDPLIGDRTLITVTNDRAGALHEDFDRFFSMRSLGLQLYSDTAAGESLADTLEQ